MRIAEVRVENVLGVRLAEIAASEDLVVVGGPNGSGKSSLLDAIWMALGGMKGGPSEPIRHGASKASVTVDLGEYRVTRKFSRSGSRLEVTNRDGVKQRRGQELLDGFLGELTFDPLAFGRMPADKQAESLRELVGIDFADLESKRQTAYDARTEANREAKRLEAQLQNVSHHAGVPAVEVSVADLAGELRKAQETNAANTLSRETFEKGLARLDEKRAELKATEARIADLQKAAEDLRQQVADWEARAESKRQEIEKLANVDQSAITLRMGTVEETNRKVRENIEHARLSEEHQASKRQAEELTTQIGQADEAKATRLEEASFPVAGLSLSDQAVTFRGIPFGQLSTAQQTGVSFAIAAAMNPTLRVVFVRNGNDLDTASLELLKERAKAADMQVWIERISEGGGATIYLDDGVARSVEHHDIEQSAAAG